MAVFFDIGSWGLSYKTFYCRNLLIFVISQSVCPWQVFPAQSNVFGWPYRKHQTKLDRLARYKHSSLLLKSVNYSSKKFYRIGPWCQFHKHFVCVTTGLSENKPVRLESIVRVHETIQIDQYIPGSAISTGENLKVVLAEFSILSQAV